MRTLTPTPEQREMLAVVRSESTAIQIDAAMAHEDLRTARARQFKMERQNKKLATYKVEFENTIIDTLRGLSNTLPKIVRPEKTYPLHLTCPIVDMARQIYVSATR